MARGMTRMAEDTTEQALDWKGLATPADVVAMMWSLFIGTVHLDLDAIFVAASIIFVLGARPPREQSQGARWSSPAAPRSRYPSFLLMRGCSASTQRTATTPGTPSPSLNPTSLRGYRSVPREPWCRGGSGPLRVACSIPGHDAAGMVGTLTVTG
jgi:hypothetical protein